MEVSEVKSCASAHSPLVSVDIPTALNEILDWHSRQMECCIPAIVERYDEEDRKNHEALVRPLVNMIMGDGEHIVRMNLKVSVWRFQVGGFLVDAPLFVGDTGWIIASDRDTALVKQLNDQVQEKDSLMKSRKGFKEPCNGGPQDPNTYVLHKYAHGLFIPDKWGNIPLPDGMEDKLVLSSISGKKEMDGYIALSPTGEPEDGRKIVIHADTGNIDIEADMPNFHLRLNGRNLYSDTNSTWAYYDGAFHNCVYQFAREFYVLPAADENGTLAIGDGCYFLSIPSATPEAATIVQYPSESSMVSLVAGIHNFENVYRTLVPIGKVLNGVMVQDFRNVTGIAAYE